MNSGPIGLRAGGFLRGNKMDIETVMVSSKKFDKSFFEIQSYMEEYEIILKQEEFESKKIASETFLNF